MIASMRIAVFLLVLANLLFLSGPGATLGTPANPDARRAEQQLLADQVLVVARGEPPRTATAGERKQARQEEWLTAVNCGLIWQRRC
jgi:hypothetical protein